MAKKCFKTGNPYEELCGKSLSGEQVAEMRENLLNFFEVLIEIDKEAGITNDKKYEKEYQQDSNIN